MTKIKTLVAGLVFGLAAAIVPVAAQEGGHSTPEIQKQSWSFSGPFGSYDENQLQRGLYVFQNSCSNCHAAKFLRFRNLAEEGGPGYSEDQAKALAATFTFADPSVEGGERPGVPADAWPAPMSAEDAIASFGVVPPDLSVMAKARTTVQPGLWWLINYPTAYQEGGADYIHALLMGYHEPPEGFELPDGKYYNEYFPGHAIGMPPPLSEGGLSLTDAEGNEVAMTLDQQATDVAAFLMWLADPHMVARKEAGFRVILFLILFAGIMYAVKRRLWSRVHH